MDNFKTVEATSNTPVYSTKPDPLIAKQRKDVAEMRASLLCCSEDQNSSVAAIRKISVLQVYHQMSRIIRYLDMMDKLEAKLYEMIDYSLDNMELGSMQDLSTLLKIQEQLQKSMLESNKLLAPYVDVTETLTELASYTEVEDVTPMQLLLPQESRDKVRNAARDILSQLDGDAS